MSPNSGFNKSSASAVHHLSGERSFPEVNILCYKNVSLKIPRSPSLPPHEFLPGYEATDDGKVKTKPSKSDNRKKILIPPPPPEACKHPESEFGSNCECFEDNTAYFGSNHKMGSENPTASRLDCQRSCADTPECKFWTWGKGKPTGPCYLKTKRDNVKSGLENYVSGTKDCVLPELKG